MAERPKTLEQMLSQSPLEEKEYGYKGGTFRAEVSIIEGKIVYIKPGFGKDIIAQKKETTKEGQ